MLRFTIEVDDEDEGYQGFASAVAACIMAAGGQAPQVTEGGSGKGRKKSSSKKKDDQNAQAQTPNPTGVPGQGPMGTGTMPGQQQMPPFVGGVPAPSQQMMPQQPAMGMPQTMPGGVPQNVMSMGGAPVNPAANIAGGMPNQQIPGMGVVGGQMPMGQTQVQPQQMVQAGFQQQYATVGEYFQDMAGWLQSDAAHAAGRSQFAQSMQGYLNQMPERATGIPALFSNCQSTAETHEYVTRLKRYDQIMTWYGQFGQQKVERGLLQVLGGRHPTTVNSNDWQACQQALLTSFQQA